MEFLVLLLEAYISKRMSKNAYIASPFNIINKWWYESWIMKDWRKLNKYWICIKLFFFFFFVVWVILSIKSTHSHCRRFRDVSREIEIQNFSLCFPLILILLFCHVLIRSKNNNYIQLQKKVYTLDKISNEATAIATAAMKCEVFL